MTKTSAINRIHELLDDNSFVEVGAYITARSTDYNMQSQETPADGVVTGYGTINGALVYVYSQDASVMGGSIGEMHAKKIEKLYHMAMKMGAPIIGLVDCAGLRLQESMDALDGFGSAEYQAKETGNVCATGSEKEIFTEIRNLVSILPANNEDDMSYSECEDDLNRICTDIENCAGDTSIALSMISDDSFYMEMKKDYAPEMVTAFIRLNGATVGCVANRSEVYTDGEKTAAYDAALTAAGCEKAAAFVNFCNAFEIPVLTLVNVDGYKNCKCNEKKIAKAAARLTYAFANADVPKVTVVVGKANGTAGLTMNSKSIGSDIVYAWKNAKIGVMEAAPAVKIMYADEIAKADNAAALINEKAAQYNEMQASALAAAKRGYVDDIIEASETRQRVVAAFEMLFTKREDRPSKKHGTI